MSFYNRLLAQAVEKFVDLQGKVEPLDVVAYGGANIINATIANGANTQILPAPAAGFSYRLHRFASVDIPNPNTAGAIALRDNVTGSTWLSMLNCFKGSEGLDGQLVSTGVSVLNGLTSPATARCTLTYDIVTTPKIS